MAVAVVRGEELMTLRQAGSLQRGDRLIIAASHEAYREFMQGYRETAASGTD